MFRQGDVPRPTRFHFVLAFAYGAVTQYGTSSQKLPLASTKLKSCSHFARHY